MFAKACQRASAHGNVQQIVHQAEQAAAVLGGLPAVHAKQGVEGQGTLSVS